MEGKNVSDRGIGDESQLLQVHPSMNPGFQTDILMWMTSHLSWIEGEAVSDSLASCSDSKVDGSA